MLCAGVPGCMPTHQTNNNASQCQQHVPADDQKLICFDNPITKRVWSLNIHVVNMENSVFFGSFVGDTTHSSNNRAHGQQ